VFRLLLAIVLAGLTVLAAACSSSESPPSGTRDKPTLIFDKLRADLGDVPRTQQGAQTFLAVNFSDRPISVGPLQVQVEQGCDQVTATDEVYEVLPQDAAILPIKLGTHKVLGPHKVVVKVPSSDPSNPLTTLSFDFVVVEDPSVRGQGPQFGVDKETIDIGDIPYDWPLYEQFTLRNDGDAPLVFEALSEVRTEEGC
jgi:hypothetical protein